MYSYQLILNSLVIESHRSTQSFYQSTQYFIFTPQDALKMTKATEITTFLKIVINRQDLTTERIETAYIFLLEGLVKKGKTRSPVGWAGILTTPLEWTLLQVSNTCLPAGPFQPPSTPADASIYPGAENQHQISPAKRYWTTSKKIWKELCNSEEG